MKTRTGIFTLIVAMLFIGLSAQVNAQGRGRGNGNGNGHGNGHNKHHDKHDKHERHDHKHYDDRHHGHWKDRTHHHNHYSDRRHVHHVYHHHQHSRDCGHTVIVHRYERPRYVYYRDYDVYYDCHREVYISYSGRNWTISTSIPIRMHHVDVRRATRVEVDYYDDDFITYIERGRPMYGRLYASW